MTEMVQTERTCPFSLAAGLQERPRVSRLRFGDGSLGWVVTTQPKPGKSWPTAGSAPEAKSAGRR